VSYHLNPLDADETANYINHRLRRAALGAPMEFRRDVTDTIHLRSRGVPRIINVICDAALVFGYAEERREMDMPLMQDVLSELEATGVLPSAPGHGDRAAAIEAAHAMAAQDAIEPAPAVALGDVHAPAAMVAAAASPAPRGVTMAEAHAELKLRATYEEAARRAADIDQREQALRQREHELAEQRRVLAEEYRLLRMQRTPPRPAAPVASGTVRVQVPGQPGASRFTPVRPEGFWGWVRRMTGTVSGHAVEEN
jgi:hypothetical protein